jgi:hypothetical protein
MIRVAAVRALLASAAVAHAAPPPPQHGPATGPCASAVQKFCTDVPLGEGRRIACLAKHQSQLTPACKERVTILQRMFKYGQEQEARTNAYLAKHAHDPDPSENVPARPAPSPHK